VHLGSLPKRLGFAGAVTAALATAVTAGLWHQLFRRPLPRTSGRIRVKGIDGAVEIRRDRWGAPHVRAGSHDDVWFGEGFCHGQDRLWQLELYRRIASGTLAEIAGREGLASDRLVRTLGMRRVAEREAATLGDELRAAMDSYCAGVNAGAAASAALPPELQILRIAFEPWRPADILVITKMLSFGLSTNWERELLRADMTRELGPELAARLDPGYPAGNPVVLTPGEGWTGDGLRIAEQIARMRDALGFAVEASGSNGWAIAPQRSRTGGALLAGDPHLPPSMPGITYQVGLEVAGRFCRGASLPGRIGIAFGQSNDVAWTFTNAMADVMDLYVERIRGETYLFEDEWRALEIREEEIAVRGRTEPERLVVRSTHHGPIVNEALRADDAEPLALRWMTLDFPAVTEATLRVFDVRSGPELVAALAPHNSPVSNLVWADRHGSIGYKTVGKLPIRAGDCPDLPKPGWTGEHEWRGWVPHDELPELTDPERGYVVSANNRITPDDFPHHVTSDYLDGYRARRIEECLEAGDEHDLSDFARLQLDTVSIPGLETVHRLARLQDPETATVHLDQREVAAIERLKSWDGRMTPESIAATIYQAFTLRLGREVARAAIGDRDLAERWLDRSHNGFMAHVTSPWRWQSHLLALWEEGDPELISRPWDELVRDALRAALDDLETRFGPDPAAWRWGRVHPLEFPHAFGAANPLFARVFNRRVEVGGAQETIAQVGWDPNDPFTAIWAPCWRMVADPADPERSRWQQFTGQSGGPASPHYDDLQERWRDGRTQALAGEGPWQTLTLEPAYAAGAAFAR
jgi:penicillin G amidase